MTINKKKKQPELKQDEYPTAYDNAGLESRRLLWVARILAFAFVCSVLVNIMLATTITFLFPLKEIRPWLVQVVDEDDVVRTLHPITTEMNGFDLLSDNLAREYLVHRESFVRDEDVMKQRWNKQGSIEMKSTRDVYAAFVPQAVQKNNNFRSRNWHQDLNIISSRKLSLPNQSSNLFIYTIDYDAIIKDRLGSVVSKRRHTATVTFKFIKMDGISQSLARLNPTGFIVTDYKITQRDE